MRAGPLGSQLNCTAARGPGSPAQLHIPICQKRKLRHQEQKPMALSLAPWTPVTSWSVMQECRGITRSDQGGLEECLAPSGLESSGQENRGHRVGWRLLTDSETNAIERHGDTSSRGCLPTLLIMAPKASPGYCCVLNIKQKGSGRGSRSPEQATTAN